MKLIEVKFKKSERGFSLWEYAIGLLTIVAVAYWGMQAMGQSLNGMIQAFTTFIDGTVVTTSPLTGAGGGTGGGSGSGT